MPSLLNGITAFYDVCPECRARAGARCVRPSGHTTATPHVTRPLLDPCPVCHRTIFERDFVTVTHLGHAHATALDGTTTFAHWLCVPPPPGAPDEQEALF